MKSIAVPSVVKWYAARDVFLGLNGHTRPHFRHGLAMAEECKPEPGCEEAAWLCNLCEAVDSPFILDDDNSDDDEFREDPNKDIPEWCVAKFFWNAIQHTTMQTPESSRLRAFYAFIKERKNGVPEVSAYLDAAEGPHGYPLAMCRLAELFSNTIRTADMNYASINPAYRDPHHAMFWATKAAGRGEPWGLYLASLFAQQAAPLANLSRAAILGWHDAEDLLASGLPETDPVHWHFAFKAAAAGINPAKFFHRLQVAANTRPGGMVSRAMYQIGASFIAAKREGQPDPECPLGWPIDACLVLNCTVAPQLVGVCLDIIAYYEKNCRDARAGVHTWTLVALRLPRLCVNTNIRRMIGEWIWAQRGDWHEWEGPAG